MDNQADAADADVRLADVAFQHFRAFPRGGL
jgi:hypothetical protein